MKNASCISFQLEKIGLKKLLYKTTDSQNEKYIPDKSVVIIYCYLLNALEKYEFLTGQDLFLYC